MLDPANPEAFTVSNDYYTTSYKGIGDEHYDIWVSRINAAYMKGIRKGLYIEDEYATYTNYLVRLLARMNEPATVPSRGFALGGAEDHQPHSIHSEVGQYLQLLKLPWLAEFENGANSPFNWMSQLLAGPYGCINYGAFNGTLFPNERNRRFCRYDTLPVYEYGGGTLVSKTVTNDSLGWEWAGLYGHSCAIHTNFFAKGLSGIPMIYNGQFTIGTYGPYWGRYSDRRTGGFRGGYYCYQDLNGTEPPYLYGSGWKGKMAYWRWPVTAATARAFNVYMYYENSPANCNTVTIRMHRLSLNAAGFPQTFLNDYEYVLNQQTHTDPLPGDVNWQRIFSNVTLGPGEMAIIELCANDGLPGDHIADAVRFISTGVNEIVDDADPTTGYPDVVGNSSGIFTTKGFYTADQITRGYEDMGDEPGGNGLSKTQFFMTNACSIARLNYMTGTLDKNIGNLYALGHNGLIFMGSVISDHWGDSKAPFTNALSAGKDFGQAYLDKMNSEFLHFFALFGAGTLKSRPYIQYGSNKIENQTISTSSTTNSWNPILVRNVTVTNTGNFQVYSTHSTSSSPVCSNSEIVIRAETWFQAGSSVVIRAQ